MDASNNNTSSKKQIRIALIGYGAEVVKTNLSHSIWKRVEEQLANHKSTLAVSFFDNEFVTTLNLENIKRWQDLNSLYHLKGLYNHTRSLIEIKIDGRKKASLRLCEILTQQYLFPIYDIENTIADKEIKGQKNIFIVEEEVGVVARYKFDADHFAINDLKFITSTINVYKGKSYTILQRVYYKNKLLKSEKSDTLVSAQYFCLSK